MSVTRSLVYLAVLPLKVSDEVRLLNAEGSEGERSEGKGGARAAVPSDPDLSLPTGSTSPDGASTVDPLYSRPRHALLHSPTLHLVTPFLLPPFSCQPPHLATLILARGTKRMGTPVVAVNSGVWDKKTSR